MVDAPNNMRGFGVYLNPETQRAALFERSDILTAVRDSTCLGKTEIRARLSSSLELIYSAQTQQLQYQVRLMVLSLSKSQLLG